MNSIKIPETESIAITLNKIKSGEIKIKDLVREHLDRAIYTQKYTNSFITILEKEALNRAEELEKRLIENPNEVLNLKLLGIPFTVKDLYLVKDTKTTFGSKLMEDFIAPYTSTIVQKCLDQGAVLIGKCNCDPWGFGGSGENSGFGPTKHPLDFEKTPGGSSSGSAASLLSGVGYFSLGTDTGGSVRLPASFCGLYGLKPTYGRNSRFGISAMGSSFDTPGFFTRYIEDMEYVEEIISGRDENDSTTYCFEYIRKDKHNSQKKSVGIVKEFMEGLSGDVRNALDNTIRKLQKQGFEIKEVSIPSTKYALSVYYILVPSEISSNRARYDGVRFGKKVDDNYEKNMVESRSMYLEKEVKRRIMIGTYTLSKGYADQFYKQASKVRTKLKREFSEALNEADFLLAPVSPSNAFKLGEKLNDPVQMYLVDIYTVTANITGLPALSIPIENDEEGMPLGLQIIGKKWEENSLFEFSKEIAK